MKSLRQWAPWQWAPRTRFFCTRATASGFIGFFAFHSAPPSTALHAEDLAAENERLRRELARLRADQKKEGYVPAATPAFTNDIVNAGSLSSRTLEGSCVFIWGQRLAFPICKASGDHKPSAHINTPVEVHWFRLHAEKNKCRWRQLAFGPSFGAARTDAGELFLWGTCRKDGEERSLEPQSLHSVAAIQSPIRDMQFSESALWALTEDGQVLVWERVPDMIMSAAGPEQKPLKAPRILEGLDRPVTNMSIGPSHASFVQDDGETYCIGSNRNGECGADPSKHAVVATCRKVQFFPGVTPVTQASCGRSHTVAMSSNGFNLAWGDDSKIQLGLGDSRSNFGDERPFSGSQGYHRMLETGEAMATPSVLRGGPSSVGIQRSPSTRRKSYGEFEAHRMWKPVTMQTIPLEFDRQVHGIPYPPPDGLVCGDDFTILIVRDSPDWFSPEEATNRLFCCGENSSGQCGRSMQTSQQTFAATRLPRNSFVQSVSCGSSHCVAVLKRAGEGARKAELWGWGDNQKGQAAGTTTGWVCPPARIKIAGMKVHTACCGFANSAVICSKRRGNSIKRVNSDGLQDASTENACERETDQSANETNVSQPRPEDKEV